MKIKALLIFCLLITISHKQVQCGFFDTLSGWFGDLVGAVTQGYFDKAGELVEKAKKAFEESMDDLFDKKLRPMIDQLDALIHRNLNKIDDIIQKIIDDFKASTLEIINSAAKQAKEMIGEEIEYIKTKIIDSAFQTANELEEKVMKDIIEIFNKIDETIYKLSCKAQSVEIRVRDDLMQSLSIIPNPWNSCRIKMDKMFPEQKLRWIRFANYQSNHLYEYRKCEILDSLDEKTPIKSVLLAYRDLEFLTAEMRCLSMAIEVTGNLKYYINEMGDVAHVIDTYESLGIRSIQKENLRFLENK